MSMWIYESATTLRLSASSQQMLPISAISFCKDLLLRVISLLNRGRRIPDLMIRFPVFLCWKELIANTRFSPYSSTLVSSDLAIFCRIAPSMIPNIIFDFCLTFYSRFSATINPLKLSTKFIFSFAFLRA